MKQGARRFFKYARDRHKIYLDRAAGRPAPFTRDPILSTYRFTNVFRELDKTTDWFRRNVRDRMRDDPDVLLATVTFRMLNRIEVGEAIFCQQMLPLGRHKKTPGPTAWDAFRGTGDVQILKQAIVTALPKGPYVTGAYIISSVPGRPKLDGVLEVIRRFATQKRTFGTYGGTEMSWRSAARVAQDNPGVTTLEEMFNYLKQFDYLGKFHSYEIVTDLRHTALLDRAKDVNTWCNVGPGARRGLNRVMGRDYKDKTTKLPQMLEEMEDILLQSQDMVNWYPGPDDGWDKWPKWEMRDVEHTLCEFDKYERVKNGEGRPRGVFR